jgi:beta-xylosidase
MNLNILPLLVLLAATSLCRAQNPIIYADVPDMAIIRIDSTYCMSSTTMHMAPGVPIMKSADLINWHLVNYAYQTLANVDAMNLVNNQSTYGRGSWASCLRHHNGLFYVSTFASTTNKTYIFTTPDLEKGPWKTIEFEPSYHDHTLFFDVDNRAYLIWGAGQLSIAQLKPDLSGIIDSTKRVLIENASAPAGNNIMLKAEGSQLFKVNNTYYLFNIVWPRGGMRTVLVHRATSLNGPWEGRVALQDKGVAQGGIIDTPDGRWFAYLFQDCGAVGRIPYLVPVTWADGWPVFGVNGKVPDTLNLPASNGPIPGIVNNDEFTRQPNEPALPLVWQWNHNPDNALWSVTERQGYLRLKTGRTDSLFLKSRNTLTQRTFGPVCSGTTLLDASNLNEGDFAGITAFQRKFGQVGVTVANGKKYLLMVNNQTDVPTEIERVMLIQNTVYLKIDCDFTNKTDIARFYYSLNGNEWIKIGNNLKMEYTLMEHFMGYRFGLFNYATKVTGGFADFDYFRISTTIAE